MFTVLRVHLPHYVYGIGQQDNTTQHKKGKDTDKQNYAPLTLATQAQRNHQSTTNPILQSSTGNIPSSGSLMILFQVSLDRKAARTSEYVSSVALVESIY